MTGTIKIFKPQQNYTSECKYFDCGVKKRDEQSSSAITQDDLIELNYAASVATLYFDCFYINSFPVIRIQL